ncbi:MAG TPA: hypothetical protein VFF10_03425 [Trueperaceae bacterium]|nr:hypothetical protein [Trueperaceae bacterium]
MLHTSHSLIRLLNDRVNELRSRAADEAVVAAVTANKRRSRREAALASIKQAVTAKEERAAFSWQSQRRAFGPRRLRSAR